MYVLLWVLIIITKITAYQKSGISHNLREYYQRIREPETTTAMD